MSTIPHRLPTLRCRAALLLLLPFAASAAQWRHVEPLPADSIAPQYYRIGSDYALWTVGSDGVRRSAAGHTRLFYRNASGYRLPHDAVSELTALNDGGALLDVSGAYGLGGSFCAAVRLDADGRTRWRAERLMGDDGCRGVYSNRAGQNWFYGGEKLFAVDADGRVGAQAAVVGQPYWTRPAAVLEDGSIAAATRLRGVSTSRMARFDVHGRELWHWVREDQKPLAFVTLARDEVMAVAVDDYNSGPNELLRWSADGQLRWSYALPTQTNITEVIAADGGEVYAVLGGGQFRSKTIQRIGADGSLRWQVEANCLMHPSGGLPLARTADDGLAYVCQEGLDPARLLRVSRGGTLSAAVPLPLHQAQQVLQQGDGRLLVLGYKPLLHGEPLTPRTLIVDGSRVDEAALDGYGDAAPSRLVGQHVFADGSSLVATAPEILQSSESSFRLTRLQPDGSVAWSRHINQPAYRSGDGLVAGGGLACVALDYSAAQAIGGMDSLLCVDAASGETRWQGAYSSDASYGLAALAIDAQGSVRSVRTTTSRHELQRFDRNGAIQSIVRSSGVIRRAAFDRHGAATVIVDAGVRQYAPDGSLRLTLPVSESPLWLSLAGSDGYLLVGDDGSFWVIAPPSPGSSAARRLWAVGPDGRTRWTRDLPDRNVDRLFLHGDALYGMGSRGGAATSDPYLIDLTRFDPANGTVKWTYSARHRRFDSQGWQGNALAVSPDGSNIALVHSEFDRLHLERVGAADGRLAHEAYLACDRLCGIPAATALGADGQVRVALDLLDRERGQSGAVIASDLSGTTTRLDQPGIDGAWWSPYAHGEGISFEWLPDSRTLFGAWFTYSSAGGNDAAELRWYTLQANGVTAGARTVELPILESTGGNFNASPAVTPRRVGSATLEFHDCANATLRYRFDADVNDGRSGLITLSRLSPATQPCILADGSSQPAAGARPPSKGFDARQSGNWYDPATGGQGLQFTVQPDGVFFAPWFTFDPADAGNDAGRQHWFTLQGDLATAANGRVELLLVQTIGGAFDRVPTYNANAIGTATLRLLGCDRAALDYRFGDEAIAGSFRGRSGTVPLQRAGGCVP